MFKLWQSKLPGIGADGAKNFFTMAYHITHGKSSWWFEGMNYPYGEHLMFTDNQPLLTNVLKWLDVAFPISENLHWLLPWFTFISFGLAAVFIGELLKKTGIHNALNALISVGIILLSPQLLRLSGHYSLSHGAVIPLIIWLLYKSSQRVTMHLDGALFLTLLLSGFLHPYLLAMGSALTFLFLLTKMFFSNSFKSRASWLHALLLGLGPLLLFQLILSITDPVTDRPPAPYGFLIYRATLSSVFMPTEMWYMDSIKSVLPFLYKRASEGGFYIGAFSMFVTIWSVFTSIKNRSIGKLNVLSLEGFSSILLISATPILLLSLGFPFVISFVEPLLDFLGPLKQFRGIGRFSFVFYYAINIYAAIFLINYFIAEPEKRKMSVLVLLIGLLWYEAYSLKTHFRDYTTNGTDWLNGTHWESLDIDHEDYQAIIPVPYFHIGSENFRTNDKQENILPSYGLSLKTGLPLTSVQMSRTSLSQTISSFQWMRKLFSPSPIIASIKDKRPFLILVDQAIDLRSYEMQLIYHSKPLLKNGQWELRTLSFDAFQNIFTENETKDRKRRTNSIALRSDQAGIYFNPYDHLNTDFSFSGNGALMVSRNDWTDLIPQDFMLEDSMDYELSFWFYAGHQNAVNTQISQWHYLDGQEVQYALSETGDHTFGIVGNWIMVKLPIKDLGNHQSLRITLQRDGKNMPIYIDEVLLKPAHLHTSKPGEFNVNNRYYEHVSSAPK